MRASHAGLGALIILAMTLAIIAGARLTVQGETAAVADDGSRAGPKKGVDETAPLTSTPPADTTAQHVETQPVTPAGPARTIDPELVAPPALRSREWERVAPREPLSSLALAQPPRPKMPDEWEGTPLFQPIASAAGLIEAKGYSIAIAGIDPVKPDETCGDAGKSWHCGLRARTAFRAFLRGRAVVCAVPPQGERDIIAARCRIGKQDIGRWLVENGWARATEDGPYAQAGEKARKAGKGIFGEAPDPSGLPPQPPAMPAAPVAPDSILAPGSDLDMDAPEARPTGQPMPFQ